MGEADKLLAAYKPEHPIAGLITREQADVLLAQEGGVEKYNDLMRRRNDAIRRSEEDPLQYGYELATWKLADVLVGLITWDEFERDPKIPATWKECEELRAMAGRILFLLILGGSRSSKTTYLGKRVVQTVVKYRHAMTWIFHTDNDMSVDWHQTLVWSFLPKSWRRQKKSKGEYVSYTTKNGFSDNKFVAKTLSKLQFRNYEQDPHKIEGGRLGEPGKGRAVGYATDELVRSNILNTLEYRCSDYDAIGLSAFTAIDGYTDAVAYYVDGAETILAEAAPEMEKNGEIPDIPLVQTHATNAKKAVMYFHSKYNPFANYENLLHTTSDKSYEERLVRLFGVPSKRKEARFPKLKRNAHGFKLADLPEEGTLYFFTDPAETGRNWACLWLLVDPLGRYWIYREWPCPNIAIPGIGFPEPWAEPGIGPGHKFDGVIGKGQSSFGFSLPDYKAEFARLEGWDDEKEDSKPVEEWLARNGAEEKIRIRYMDPRFGSLKKTTASMTTDLFQEMALLKMPFIPAPGGGIDGGIDLINSRLKYKEGWEMPEDGPKLFLANEADNIWFAMRTWTGLDGRKGATKDWIDLLRYAVSSRPLYVDADKMDPRRRVSRRSANPKAAARRRRDAARRARR